MSSYQGRDGVWVTYSYDAAPYVMKLYTDVVPAAKDCASQGYGSILFWPFGMELREAIEWWTEQEKNPLADSVVHFHYTESGNGLDPFCETPNQNEWVQIDPTAIGKICQRCLGKIESYS